MLGSEESRVARMVRACAVGRGEVEVKMRTVRREARREKWVLRTSMAVCFVYVRGVLKVGEENLSRRGCEQVVKGGL